MLCPGCGLENAVDAWFCGGCGVRLDIGADNSLSPLQELDSTGGLAGSQSQQGQSSVQVSSSLDVFVGRQQEMSELKSALEDAMSGHGRMVGEKAGKIRSRIKKTPSEIAVNGAHVLN